MGNEAKKSLKQIALEDIYNIILFFRDNTEDDDLYLALDELLRDIEEFSSVRQEISGDIEAFMRKLYTKVINNPLTKFLGVYLKDYV
jgi:hypothetical protein